MKKTLLSLFLAVVLLFSLTACGGPSNPTETNTNQAGSSDQPQAQELILQYDDRYVFSEKVESIVSHEITSKKARTEDADDAVLEVKSRVHSNTVIACGTGKATVTLADGTVYNVTVTPAPISVFLILGQSNGEGSTTGDAAVYNKARAQSIACEEGKVYSTYAWSTTGHATMVAGLTSSKNLSTTTAKNFVAGTLTSNNTADGTRLEYPLNSLCSGKNGKAGFDSGLAWKWTQLTGEKVWIVNCAAGSTSIDVWLPGQPRYEMCRALMACVKETMDAEVAAGHYEMKNYAYFWLQGESDSGSSKNVYRDKLDTFHENLKKDIVMTNGKALEAAGIILVRAFATTNPTADTMDNGPRQAQKAFTRELADAFMACDVNDLWISAKGVQDYWNTKYPDSKYPFTTSSQTYQNPTTIGEVHTGVHYLQPGYNEIGIVAAEQAYDYLD